MKPCAACKGKGCKTCDSTGYADAASNPHRQETMMQAPPKKGPKKKGGR